MTAADRLAAAVAKVEQAPAAEVPPFAMKIAMDNGRVAVVTIPGDTSDTELIALVAIITGPGRIELHGQQAKAATGLVRASSMPRPV